MNTAVYHDRTATKLIIAVRAAMIGKRDHERPCGNRHDLGHHPLRNQSAQMGGQQDQARGRDHRQREAHADRKPSRQGTQRRRLPERGRATSTSKGGDVPPSLRAIREHACIRRARSPCDREYRDVDGGSLAILTLSL
ncbi:hypothetical protein AB0B25_10875 [Nocardia sp. NPDC049190]|uniref:hypothetical protein n=1 Tax=Nocardia sp. NPDC049190 TaxID=3155650 RepID=UPI0033C77A38